MTGTKNRQAIEDENKKIRACRKMQAAVDKLNNDLKAEAMTAVATNIQANANAGTFSYPQGAPKKIKDDVDGLNAAIAAAKAFGNIKIGITKTANKTTLDVRDGSTETPVPNPYQSVSAVCN